MTFSEQFKNQNMSKTIDYLKQKYQPQKQSNLTQDEVLNVLYQEKEQEKDDKIKGNYDLIIAAVKDFFAKKFNQAKARQTIMSKAKDEVLAKKALEIVGGNQALEQFAKQLLGANFVDNTKKNNAYTKKQQSSSFVRSL